MPRSTQRPSAELESDCRRSRVSPRKHQQNLSADLATVPSVHTKPVALGLQRIAFRVVTASAIVFLGAHQARVTERAQLMLERPDSEGKRTRDRPKVVTGQREHVRVDAASRGALQNARCAGATTDEGAVASRPTWTEPGKGLGTPVELPL